MGKITLYTPNTGLPDLELKIAYGLCRVAFEAGLEFEMRPREGFYEIRVENEGEETRESRTNQRLEKSFWGLLKRFLSVAHNFSTLPGMDDPEMARFESSDIKRFKETEALLKEKLKPNGHEVPKEIADLIDGFIDKKANLRKICCSRPQKKKRSTYEKILGKSLPDSITNLVILNQYLLSVSSVKDKRGKNSWLLKIQEKHQQLSDEINKPLFVFHKVPVNRTQQVMGTTLCGHDRPRFAGTSGAILSNSFVVGKPTKRDQLARDNLGLCETCGWLATIGYHSVGLRFNAGDSRMVILPELEPDVSIDRAFFQDLLSIQRELGWSKFPKEMGLRDLPLLIFARYPHLSNFMFKQNLHMNIHILMRNPNGSWGTMDAWSTRIDGYAGFIKGQSDTYEPQNIALVQRMSWNQNINDTKGVFPLLTKALNSGDAGERQRFAALFARELAAKMAKIKDSTDFYLLSRKTSFYLLEVMNMNAKIYNDPIIDEVAKLLRYFVKKKRYQFVDDIRNAKGPNKLQEVLALAVREAHALRDKETHKDNQGIWVPYLEDSVIKGLSRKITSPGNGTEDKPEWNFNDVKYALAILAFTRESREKNKEA